MLMDHNLSALCIVNSETPTEYENLPETIWAPLNHFGIPYVIFDLAFGNELPDSIHSFSVIILGQENISSCLSEYNGDALKRAIKSGVGFVSFDSDIHHMPASLKSALGIKTSGEQTHMHVGFIGLPDSNTQAVRTVNNDHFITYTRELEFIHFNKPVTAGNIVGIGSNAMVLMVQANSSGCPALVVTSFGKARVVLFTLSPRLWLREYFGHGGGLTDIFWKSIIWAARKPFTMFAMPPFATMRVDDCSGTTDHFAWVDTVNKHNIIPHCSLFIDNITEQGIQIIKNKYDAGLAEFSAHAFTWTRIPYWKPEDPGSHTSGQELPENELKDAFQGIDAKFTEWGIKPSRIFLPHFGEVGRNVLPLLKERDIMFFGIPMQIGLPFNFNVGGPRVGYLPFGGQGGTLDKHPEDPDFFIVESDYTTLPKAEIDHKVAKGEIKVPFQMYDFLWDWGRDEVNIEAAARHAANQLKLGIDNLIFGQINTHEQNIAVLSSTEWENLLTRVEEITARYKVTWKKWEYIASYAGDKYSVKLISADYNTVTKNISCQFRGRSSQTLYLYVFIERDNSTEYYLLPVPAFKKSTHIVFPVKIK
jgi:hypothetical protein